MYEGTLAFAMGLIAAGSCMIVVSISGFIFVRCIELGARLKCQLKASKSWRENTSKQSATPAPSLYWSV